MLEILIFVIIVFCVVLLINAAVAQLLPEAAYVVRIVAGCVAVILILKKLWPLFAHGLS